jgi:glycosyltransferase involved in cell wall biosynthesis
MRAFAQLEGDRFALWVFGQGDLEGEIREAAVRDARITYWGNVPAEELFPRIERASVMVNPRPADEKISPFSFPSKLLEYLALGKIAISARLQGIPPEYHSYLALVDPMDECHLADTLRSLALQDAAQRRKQEDGARQFAWSNKTQEHQGRRIVEFLRTIA